MNTNYNPNQPGGQDTPPTPQESNFWKNPEPSEPAAQQPSMSQPVHTEPVQPTADSVPQTPYQTPVRSSADTDQPIYHDQAHQTTEPPFASGSASYHTYQEWQAQEHKRHAKKERKPRSKKPFIIAGSIVAAAALFCGGLFLGSSQMGGTGTSASSSNQNLPTLTISATPKDDSSSSSSGGVLSGEEIYQKLNNSIVAIQSSDASGQVASSGSGVVMSEDGYIITNAHVITDEDTGAAMSSISVLFADGSQLAASIVGSDDQTDLAVLKVEPTSKLTPAEFGDSDQLQVGEDAYAIGSPGGVQLANSMTSGIISAINRDITVNDRVMSLIQTNVTINPGNSGGALINKYGQVVGITSAKLGISYYEGLGFAIPINSAKEIVDELIQNGYISGRPSIGITGRNINEQMAQYRNLPQGVEIASIDSRADASTQGLQAGDVITAVNGTAITTMDEINSIKEDMQAGDKLTLTIYRPSAQKSMDVTITLTDAHDLEGTDPAQQQQQQQQQQDQNNYGNYGSYGNGGYVDPFQYFFGY
ncbi:MAG: trypsin-like peptidase domain-containing protein [Butyricicoccus sp.]|nr:trypsin-like peptidase domain-containing protein [Butyricicoccus sp.]